MRNNLKHLKIFAFTHHKLEVVKIGLLHIEAEDQAARLKRKETKEILLGKTERLYTKLRNLRRKSQKRKQHV